MSQVSNLYCGNCLQIVKMEESQKREPKAICPHYFHKTCWVPPGDCLSCGLFVNQDDFEVISPKVKRQSPPPLRRANGSGNLICFAKGLQEKKQ